MLKVNDQQINEKVLHLICENIKQGSWKNRIFSIVSTLLESDTLFSSANVEFDLKKYIIENHDVSKLTDKLIKFDSRKLSRSFAKHEQNPNVNLVFEKICVKKGNKIIFDTEKHHLFKSEILQSPYLSYELPFGLKVLIQTLVQTTVKEK